MVELDELVGRFTGVELVVVAAWLRVVVAPIPLAFEFVQEVVSNVGATAIATSLRRSRTRPLSTSIIRTTLSVHQKFPGGSQ